MREEGGRKDGERETEKGERETDEVCYSIIIILSHFIVGEELFLSSDMQTAPAR